MIEKTSSTYIEPSETAPRGPQDAFFGTSCTFLEPPHGPDPFLRCDGAEVDLLLMQVGSNVRAKQAEKGCNGKCFVTISNDLKVDAVVVVVVGQERDGGVDGHHEEDPNNMSLLPGFQVVCRMHRDEEERDDDGDEGEDRAEVETKVVEGFVVPYGVFRDRHILQRRVAFWPAHLDCACIFRCFFRVVFATALWQDHRSRGAKGEPEDCWRLRQRRARTVHDGLGVVCGRL